MFADNELSTTPVPGNFTGARALAVSKTIDYEHGGIALNDPSMGLHYQVWKASIVEEDVFFEATYVPKFVVYSGADITEISFTFDQNMRPVLAFVQAGQSYLRWYDSSVGGQVVTALATDVITPKVTLDDKRLLEISISDVILAYVRSGSLYVRRQRDRFLIEYLQEPGVTTGLIKIGMNKQLRLQFMLEPV